MKLSRGSRVVPWGQTDRHDEAKSLFVTLRMRLKTESIILPSCSRRKIIPRLVQPTPGRHEWVELYNYPQAFMAWTRENSTVLPSMFHVSIRIPATPKSTTPFTSVTWNVLSLKITPKNSLVFNHQGWPASRSSGQGFWLLNTRSRVRFPALPWEFSL